jgi:addiction module HigA family antidote
MGVDRLPAFEPPHPGEMLRDDVLPAAGLTASEAARRLGVSRQALHAVLSGKTGLSAEMAIRVSRLFGSTPSHWLAIQAAHDLWHVERRGAAEFDRIEKVA